MTPVSYTHLDVYKRQTGDSFQCYTLGFGVEADPNEYNEYFSTSTGAGSWNFIHYSNPEVDQLFKDQLLLTDPDERAECFHKISDLISKDLPWIPLYNKAGIDVYKRQPLRFGSLNLQTLPYCR